MDHNAPVTVLVVEDNELILGFVNKTVSDAGFKVTSVTNAEDALKSIQEHKPDIILLDIILPGMDGLEFLKTVRKDGELKNIPVVIISNLSGRDDVDKGMLMGANSYLIKSNILPEDVIKKINEVLKR